MSSSFLPKQNQNIYLHVAYLHVDKGNVNILHACVCLVLYIYVYAY